MFLFGIGVFLHQKGKALQGNIVLSTKGANLVEISSAQMAHTELLHEVCFYAVVKKICMEKPLKKTAQKCRSCSLYTVLELFLELYATYFSSSSSVCFGLGFF